MQPHVLLSSLLLLAPLTSAWEPLAAVRQQIAPLLPRATPTSINKDAAAASSSATSTDKKSSVTSTAPSASGSASSTSGKSSTDDKSTNKDGSTITSTNKSSDGKGSTDKSSTITSSSYDTTKTFNPVLPPGGVQMVTPNTITEATQFYRIEQPVTFAWNYTSLKATPSAVNVLISCSQNSATYTVKTDLPVAANGTQVVTWDTNQYATQTERLIQASYTLVIYDAAKSVTDTPQAGYLGTYDQFYFGMYYGQQYENNQALKWVCATCNGNGAMGSMGQVTLGFVFGMAALTVVSFGWFGGVAGIW